MRFRASTILLITSAGILCPPGGARAQLSDDDLAELRARGQREGWTFEVGRNPATELPLEKLCGLNRPADWQAKAPFVDVRPRLRGPLPSAFDWRQQANLPPVRDQDGCGGCWAFSTVGALECSIAIRDSQVVDLSEQWLLNCNREGWNCVLGGWFAHDYHRWKTDSCGDTGAVPESECPFVGHDASCACPYPHTYRIQTWAYIGSATTTPAVNAIKQAMLDYGPVSAAVCADNAMSAYKGGVFNQCAICSPDPVNHGVVIVGWDDSQGSSGVWIMRNSWGPGWGEDGYMRIQYGCSSIGYAANFIDYQPTGACCAGGSCAVTTQANCTGSWTGGVACTPSPCDTTPPTVILDNPTAGQTFTTTPITVSGTADDPGSPSSGVALVQVRVNGGSWQTASGTASWSASLDLSSGSNVIEAGAKDGAGNYSTPALATVTYNPPDTTPPTVTIGSPANGQTFTTTPITVSGTADDPGSPSSGVLLVQVRVNGGSWQTASGTASWSASLGLSSGSNAIEARGKDGAGNYSTLAAASVTYDPAGACCLADGGCIAGAPESACTAAGGASWNEGATCAQAACPQPAAGACCVGGATCLTNVTQAHCASQSGTWQGADSTSCTDCPAKPVQPAKPDCGGCGVGGAGLAPLMLGAVLTIRSIFGRKFTRRHREE